MPAEIADKCWLIALRLEERRNAFSLVETDFDRRKSARRQQARDFRGEAAIFVKALGSGEQRLGRFIVGYPRAEYRAPSAT